MKEKIIVIHKNPNVIDSFYFKYYGLGPYKKTYLSATVNPTKVIEDMVSLNIFFETLLDVGCASGEVVRDFRSLGVKAYGIDNNKEILSESVVPQFCAEMDLRDLSKVNDNFFCLLYVNSLMYVFPSEIPNILRGFHRICKKAVYLCNPFLEDCIENHYLDSSRVFLAKEVWWTKQFEEAGFTKIASNIYEKS